MSKSYLPKRPSKLRCTILIGIVLCLFLLKTPDTMAIIGSQTFNYILMPILWLGVVLIIFKFPAMRPKAKLRHKAFLNWWAFNFAVIFVAVSVMAGIFIDGMGLSPYNHSLQGIMLNVLAVGSVLVGRELVRSYLVNSLTSNENYLVFTIIALFMSIANIAIKDFIDIKGYQGAVIFVAQTLAPEFCHNLFATYLAFLGGSLPAIIYMGIIQAFHWLSPILPNLKWITAALIGILLPVFSLSIMQNIYLTETKKLKLKDRNEESPLGWIVTTISSIVIVWFSVGMFPVYPSVIATGSMEPMIKPGDVILVKKADKEYIDTLEPGHVIQFRRDDILISHRIIEVMEEEGIKSYRTKGDNNSAEDPDLIKPEQIKGEILHVVPKVGWPTLLMKGDMDIPLKNIEF